MGHRILYIPKLKNAIFYPEYGLLYNWYAATDVRNIAAEGWHLPNVTEATALRTYLIDNDYACGDDSTYVAKSIASKTLWESSTNLCAVGNNLELNNSSGFNAKPTGVRRDTDGAFLNMHRHFYVILSNTFGNNVYVFQTSFLWPTIVINRALDKEHGNTVRLIKDSTTLAHGQTGTYTGNDGKIYPTICIGTQEWLADSLSETKFRNGEIIPWHGADPGNFFTNAEWAALTTAGMCAYNNDVNNVAAGFTFPT